VTGENLLLIKEFAFLGVFLMLVFGVPALVVWASYNEGERFKQFDVSTLWTHRDRVDKFAVIILGTWWSHTCAMVTETLLRTVETADWTTYQLWAIPIMAKMFAPSGSALSKEEAAP
jgi:hypothetical protein